MEHEREILADLMKAAMERGIDVPHRIADNIRKQTKPLQLEETMDNKQNQLDDLTAAKPYFRTVFAFILFVVRGTDVEKGVESAYAVSDKFIEKLTSDVNAS